MVAQHDDVILTCEGAGKIKERVFRIRPLGVSLGQVVLVQQLPVAAWGNGTDVPQLLRVANNDRGLCSEQQRQGRGTSYWLALSSRQVEEAGLNGTRPLVESDVTAQQDSMFGQGRKSL